MRTYLRLLLVSLAIFLPVRATAQDVEVSLPIKCHKGTVIVEGMINNCRRVSMMIDTGAGCSVLSAHLAKELRLRIVLESTPVSAAERVIRCPLVAIPSIRLGAISRALSCPAADLPVPDVDMLVGRDVLRNMTITVDYKARVLHLGKGAPLAQSVTFDPERKEILVPLQIGNVEIPVKVDSGADALYLFKHKVSSWIKRNMSRDIRLVGCLTMTATATVVSLGDISLGGAGLGSTNAMVIESQPRGSSQAEEWHGLLGLSVLKARQVRLDLKDGVLSWER